jgi:hypothetical protein
MTDGLVSPDVRISTGDLERYALCGDGARSAALALERTATALAERLGDEAQIVLLGSVRTGKYTDVLAPIFGERLLFPRDVLHIGQLARGALFLRRAQQGHELDYTPVGEIVRAGRRVSIRGAATLSSPEGAPTESPRPATPPSTEDARAKSPR